MRLKDKAAIVTGASRGIGRVIALALAKEGASVVVADREPGHETVKMIQELGRSGLYVQVDVRDAASVQNLISRTIEEFGKVDVLVNNAGVFIFARVEDMTEEQWDLIFDVNIKGMFLCCKAVAREMIARKVPGKIVNVSSSAGLAGHVGYSAYCSSKRAVLAFTESLAKELGPCGINVNAICPGDTETDMLADEVRKVAKQKSISEDRVRQDKLQNIPLGRFATPDDIANVVVFLVSNESRHVSGEFIKITGGK
ncbi:MAG: SDR family NAD(P)-dependent oxidoreductase [Candidatus Bathyarchaeia archaeon]